MNEKYEKIINLPHHISNSRQRMSREDRAAQFAPYSALSGYEDAVEETARLTDHFIELDESENEKINDTLTTLLSSPIGTKAKITFFVPDKRKKGGKYITLTEEVGKIDYNRQEISFTNGTTVIFKNILEIHKID